MDGIFRPPTGSQGTGKQKGSKAGDEPTAGLLTQRLTVHEPTARMLRSLLEE